MSAELKPVDMSQAKRIISQQQGRIEALAATNKQLVAALGLCEVEMYAAAEASHLTDGFRGRVRNKHDENYAVVKAALAAAKGE